MADLTLSAAFDAVYQIETGDPVLGGANGISNRQAQQLGNRTEFLKEALQNAGLINNAPFGGDLALLRTPGVFVVTDGATNKPVAGNGTCLVAYTKSIGTSGNHYAHYYIDANNNFYTRTYVNNVPVTDWQAYLKKSVYDTLQLAEVGKLSLFFGNGTKVGWLLCSGQQIPRGGQYANLFAVIGTAYGAGNGISTFEIPNITNTPVSPSGSDQFNWYIKY